jgi:hypothetical protein
MRKWLLLLAVFITLGTAVIVWLGVEDARQADLLDAQVRRASDRLNQADDRFLRAHARMVVEGDADDLLRAEAEQAEAGYALQALTMEQYLRQQTWHARLLREARRRAGW